MRNLLSANFARLWKSRFFWVMESAAALWAAVVYLLDIYNGMRLGPGWILSRSGFSFLYPTLYIAPALAVFTGFYIGVEHANGTIRNKLTAGHSRRAVYLSYVLVSFTAALLFLATHMVIACIAAPLGLGIQAFAALERPLLSVLCAVCLTAAFTALFAMIATLDSNQARVMAVSLVLSVALIFIGMMIFTHLRDLEQSYQAAVSATPPDPERIRMLSGMQKIFKVLEVLFPSSQIMSLNRPQAYAAAYCLGYAAALTGFGLWRFGKKDLK